MTIASGTNCWTHAIDTIVASIPQTEAFRTLTDTTTAAAAAKYVKHKTYLPPSLEEFFDLDTIQEPSGWAVVLSPINEPYKKLRSRSEFYEPYGRVMVLVARTVFDLESSRFDDTAAEEDRTFENLIGDMIEQLITYIEENRTFRIKGITVTEATVRVRPNQRESAGNLQYATLAIDWGFQ